nr:MAG TPA: hypothetical protein [Caudoviricetes sp.]
MYFYREIIKLSSSKIGKIIILIFDRLISPWTQYSFVVLGP